MIGLVQKVMKKSLAFSLPDNFLAAFYLILTTLLLPIGNASAGHPDGLIVFDQEIPKLGDIRIFSGSFIPFSGTWAECNGQMVSKEQYGKLFSIIGTTYGGDGNPNFALPTLTPPLKGLRYLICVRGLYRQKDQTPSIDSQASLLSPDNGPAPGLPFIGAIRGFSGSSYVPLSGTWAECNGQMVSKEQYGKLFSIIGTTYGGNGNPNFALPNLAPLDGKIRYLICVSGDYPNKSNESRQLNNRPTLNPSIKHDK